MRLTSILVIALLSAILVSTTACESETYHLNTSVSGQGIVSPSSGTYADGEVVAVAAIPASDWEFDRWEGSFTGNENPVYIRMNSDKTLDAYFTEVPTPTSTPMPTATPTPISSPTPEGPERVGGCGTENCTLSFEDIGSSMRIKCGECWEGDLFTYVGEFIYEDEPDRGYYNLTDPSFTELMDFLADDKTDEIPYSRPDFMCHHFSLTLRENANKQGLRCAWVEVGSVPAEGGMGLNYAHAITAFNTTDRGIIYIDPQDDSICQIREQWQPSLCCVENIEELDNLCDPSYFHSRSVIYRLIRIW